MNQHKQDNNLIPEALRKKLSNISLTADEKQSVRRQLRNALTEKASTPNSQHKNQWINRLQQLPTMFTKAAVGFAGVLFLLGGLTYAAEDALPGTPLYAIKTQVNEAFISLTAFSNSKTAATQSQLAARRINELQRLIREGKLTTTTSQELLGEIAAHTKIARENIADLESASKKKQQQAVQLRSQLTALLAAEGENLQSATTSTAGPSNDENNLVKKAARKLIAIANQNSQLTASTTNSKLAQSAVTDLLRLATDRLEAVYGTYQDQESIRQTPPPQALVKAAHNLESALTNVQRTDYSQAVNNLESLFVRAQQARRALGPTSSTVATNTVSITNTIKSDYASSTDDQTKSTSTSIQDNNQASNQQATGSDSAINLTAQGSAPTPTTTEAAEAMPPVPSRQNIHNKKIRQIISAVRAYLKKTQTSSSTDTPHSTSTVSSSTRTRVNKLQINTPRSTSSSTTTTQAQSSSTASSSGVQPGDESGL